ncbi:MAG: MFS transporter [Gammaproteobacteria bacterium]
MKRDIGTFSSLKSNQREAFGLLSIGTFLEYFDLMIYVHMAALLNELFFPKVDPDTAVLLQAFAFCTAFIFRPLGALIIGAIGDVWGRKSTVVITTIMMAISCLIMANLPTYSQIGIAASWIVTLCRICQGISSVGEIVGAELYLTEITKPPIQYPIVASIAVTSILGTVAALIIVDIVLKYGFEWRIAFWIGACIALIGAVARTALRETCDFTDAKKLMKKRYEQASMDPSLADNSIMISKEKINKKVIIYLFIMHCAWPMCFYLGYIHCPNILKNSFGYDTSAIIHHNFFVSLVQLVIAILMACLTYKVYPLILVKIKLIIFSIFVLLCPYLLSNITTPFHLFLIQSFLISFGGITGLAMPIFFKHIPVFKRFTYSSVTYALSRALMYIITSFGIIYLTKYFGFYGLLVIMVPIHIGGYLGICYFEKLEKVAGNHPQKKMFSEIALVG